MQDRKARVHVAVGVPVVDIELVCEHFEGLFEVGDVTLLLDD